MGYIDAEKLIAEIKRYKNKADERLKIKGRTFSEEQKDLALQNLCGNLLHFIGSLQQEEREKIVQPTVEIKGWVAKNGASNEKTYMYPYDNSIVFSEIKPTRDEYYKHWTYAKFYLSPKTFPDLKWEDEPIEVTLLINK